MEQREEFVEAGHGLLWTATSGTGVPLVLCHGGPGAYDYLQPVAEMVDDLARVHRFDQRGGGRSTGSGPWTVSALVSDIDSLRDHWGHKRWLVGGQSWGAHLALFYALTHPDRTLGVIFLNGTGVRWGWGAERRVNRVRRLTADEQAEVAQLDRELIGGRHTHARERMRELMWLTDFADRANATGRPGFNAYPREPSVVESLERDWQVALDGIEDALSQLAVPVLVLHGAADPIGEAGPRDLARLLPRGRFVALPGVGHLPWLEDSTELRRELRSFVGAFRSHN